MVWKNKNFSFTFAFVLYADCTCTQIYRNKYIYIKGKKRNWKWNEMNNLSFERIIKYGKSVLDEGNKEWKFYWGLVSSESISMYEVRNEKSK